MFASVATGVPVEAQSAPESTAFKLADDTAVVDCTASACDHCFYDVAGIVHSLIAFMLSGLQSIKAYGGTLLWICGHLLLFYLLLCIGVD